MSIKPDYREKLDNVKDDLNYLGYITKDPKNGERISLLIHIISRVEANLETDEQQ